VFAGLRLSDPQLRVLTTTPMDRQDDFARGLIDIDNDVGDKGAQELLPEEFRLTSLPPSEYLTMA